MVSFLLYSMDEEAKKEASRTNEKEKQIELDNHHKLMEELCKSILTNSRFIFFPDSVVLLEFFNCFVFMKQKFGSMDE
jgi:hypothetical protein